MAYDINTHGDFQRFYDTRLKRNYWLLGYYGGGSVNVEETYELAKQFAELVKVPLNSVKIDEVLYSRRYKNFKFLFSDSPNQKVEENSYQSDNVWELLTN